MIEVVGIQILKNRVRVGITQGNLVFLERELSGVDRRKIREALKAKGMKNVEFAKLGNITKV